MNIFMWSGPRNISTALMRSFENRDDTEVIDEPFYAYYLKKTKKSHPMSKTIINSYDTNLKSIINKISKKQSNGKILYQKHMTHHILNNVSIEWISKGINCFLIRDPKKVINSYTKENFLFDSSDIGFPNQMKLFKYIFKINDCPIVINSDDLLKNPEKNIKILCKKLNIPFTKKMMKWPKGPRDSDGIWSKIWYKQVNQSTNFVKYKKKPIQIDNKYNNIYNECKKIFDELNKYNLFNE